MIKKALITGFTGQDGSYLAELLLSKNYQVFGFGREKSYLQSENIADTRADINFISGDISDKTSIYEAVKKAQPEEIYNLASKSHPGSSWGAPFETMDIVGIGAHRVFDVVKQIKPECKIYQASTSELYGDSNKLPQDEDTPFNPLNPYAAAKLYAHNMAKIYRKSHGMFIACGILFNHESPRRGLHFITQKIAYAAACIKLGINTSSALNEHGEPIVKNGKVAIGNLDAERDWGYAKDYVQAMWLMLQQDTPDDFTIGSGQLRTIRDLCKIAFKKVNLDWQNYVLVDPKLFRPTETGPNLADIVKAKKILGWEPKKCFEELISEMLICHLNNLQREVEDHARNNSYI